MALSMFDQLMSMEKNTYTNGLQGKKICIYGSNGTGKTYQTTRLPKALLLEVEAGGSAVNCYKKPVQSWAIATNIFKTLSDPTTLEQMQEKFQTIVIDTAEQLVTLSEQAIAKQYGVASIGSVAEATNNKTNGYALARANFSTEINKLTMMGYTVVFIMHEEKVEKVDELTGQAYSYTQPKGSDKEKGSLRFIRDLCDFTIYLKPRGLNSTTGEYEKSIGICQDTKNVFARSRFAIQPFIDPFTAKGLEDAIQKAVETSAKEEEVEIKDFTLEKPQLDVETLKTMLHPVIKTLYPNFPNEVKRYMAMYLGEGVKVSEATEVQQAGLENLYNDLITFANVQDIVISE